MRFFSSPSDEALRIHNESKVIDIHCHPSLKMNLYNYKIYDKEHFPFPSLEAKSSRSDEFFQMQYDLNQMYYGKVDAIWSSVYIIEKGFINSSDSLKNGYWGAHLLGLENLVNSIERDSPYGPYVQAIETIDKIENQIIISKEKGYNVTSAKNFDDFKNALDSGVTCLVHSIEGAHMLGRGLKSIDEYLTHVQTLFSKGVCSVTLGHFMPNSICFPVSGIAPGTRRAIGFHYSYGEFQNEPLLHAGKAVVDFMFDIGMIVDLNHVTINGRKEVFNINNARGSNKRPLVFTHNGLRRNVPHEPLTVSDEEVLEIQKCNGVIGIIFMNYWLTGKEKMPDDGIENIIKTIKDIAKICNGSYDNIAIGSDMDGFTQPVDDLFIPSQMIRLTQVMIDEGISETDIKKILGGNALRVMKDGWGRN